MPHTEAGATITIRDNYLEDALPAATRDVARLALQEEKLNEEAVAHLVQLAYLGRFSEAELAPVRTILEQLFDGSQRHMSRALDADQTMRTTGRPDFALVGSGPESQAGARAGPPFYVAPGTTEFNRWFAASKVVNAKGAPLVVYHGTQFNFDEFDSSKLGRGTQAPSAREGFFFTDRRKTAEYYSPGESFNRKEAIKVAAAARRHAERMVRHYEQTVSVRETDADKADLAKWQAKLAEIGEPHIKEVYLSLQNPLVHDFKGKVYRDDTYLDLIKRAKAEGRDGLILKRTYDAGENSRLDAWMRGRFKGETIYVAFEPGQIKSATPDLSRQGQPKFSLMGIQQRRDLDQLGFYSKALEVAKGLKQEKWTPADLRNALRNAQVKEAELQAVGFDTFLNGRKSVSKAEVVSFLTDNRVGLRESVYRNDAGEFRFVDDIIDDEPVTQVLNRQGDVVAEISPQGDGSLLVARVGQRDGNDWTSVSNDMVVPDMEAAKNLFRPTRWAGYSVDPSNPTYRESVLHLPMPRTRVEIGEATPFGGSGEGMWEGRFGVKGVTEAPFRIGDEAGTIRYWPETYDHRGGRQGPRYVAYSPNFQGVQLKSLDELRVAIEGNYNAQPYTSSTGQYFGDGMSRTRRDVFRDSHFPNEPNPIVNVGTSIQKDAAGKSVGLLDRFQPQWAQNIRDSMRNAYAKDMFGPESVQGKAKIAELIGARDKAYEAREVLAQQAHELATEAGLVHGGRGSRFMRNNGTIDIPAVHTAMDWLQDTKNYSADIAARAKALEQQMDAAVKTEKRFDDELVSARTQKGFASLTDKQKAEVGKAIDKDRKAGTIKGGVRDEAKIADLEKQLADARKDLLAEAERANREMDANGVEPASMHGPRYSADEIAFERINAVEEQYRAAERSGDDARIGELVGRAGEVNELGKRIFKHGTEMRRIEAEIQTARAATPGHPLVNTTDQALETGLKRVLQQFIDAGVDRIAISPAQALIQRGEGANNPAGMRAFYDDILPKALLKLLRSYDPSIKGPSDEGLFSSLDGRVLEIPAGELAFHTFPLTDKVKQSILEGGQPMFSLMGPRAARGEDQVALEAAQFMERAGRSEQDIWRATGWFRWHGQWVREFSDEDFALRPAAEAALRGKGTTKLPAAAFASHAEMWRRYPELAHLTVELRRTRSIGDVAAMREAGFADNAGHVPMRPAYADLDRGAMTIVAATPEEAKQKFLIEMFRWIARAEKLPEGGSPASAMEAMDRIGRSINAQAAAALERLGALENASGSADLADELNKLKAVRAALTDITPVVAYRRLAGTAAGEAIARRMGLTEAERRAQPFRDAEGVPREQQIVTRRGPQRQFGTDWEEDAWEELSRRGDFSERPSGMGLRPDLNDPMARVFREAPKLERKLLDEGRTMGEVAAALEAQFGVPFNPGAIGQRDAWWRLNEIVSREEGRNYRWTAENRAEIARRFDAGEGIEQIAREMSGPPEQGGIGRPVTYHMIRTQLESLPVARRQAPRGVRWSEQRNRLLTELWDHNGPEAIAAQLEQQKPRLRYSARMVEEQAHFLGLTATREPWTQARDAELRRLDAEGMPIKQIASTMGVSVPTISRQMKKLGVSRYGKWTAEQIAEFRRLDAAGTPERDIAAAMSRMTGSEISVGQIHRRRQDAIAAGTMVRRRSLETWTPEMIATLTSDDMAGLPAREVAQILSQRFPEAPVTRDAVIGKRNRLALEGERKVQVALREADALGLPVDQMLEEHLGDTAPILKAVRSQKADLIAMWQHATAARQTKWPERLVSFLVRTGGIRDEGGDVLRMLGSHRQRPGLIAKGGSALDDATLRAWEAGYLTGEQRPAINDLLAAIDEDLRGRPVVRRTDFEAIENASDLAEIETNLERYGIAGAKTEAEALKRLDDHLRTTAAQRAEEAAGSAQKGPLSAATSARASRRAAADVEGRALASDPVADEMDAATRATNIAETLKACKS